MYFGYYSFGGRVVIILAMIFEFLAYIIIVGYISLFLNDFVVPIMYKYNITTSRAWFKFFPILGRYMGYFILYGLFIFVLGILVVLCVALSIGDVVEYANNNISLFKNYSFHKQIAYIIIVAIGYGAYTIYDSELSNNDDAINPLIVAFPIVAFLLTYLLGEYGTQYIVFLFALYLGYDFVQKGIEKKDAIRIGLGVVTAVTVFLVKVIDLLRENLQEKIVIGLLVTFIGAMFIAIVYYLRSQWTVTSAELANTASNNFDKNTDIIDNINIDNSSDN